MQLQDKWGRAVQLTQSGGDWIYTGQGTTVTLQSRDDAKALAQIGQVNAPAPSPAPAPNPVPTEVTMRQARLALLAAGKLDAVAAAIASLPSPQKEAAQIEWEYSSAVQRQQPLVVQLGAAVGLSSAQLDALFIDAASR